MLEKHRPDLVLLDVQMPGMDGFQTLSEIRKKRPPRCRRAVSDRPGPSALEDQGPGTRGGRFSRQAFRQIGAFGQNQRRAEAFAPPPKPRGGHGRRYFRRGTARAFAKHGAGPQDGHHNLRRAGRPDSAQGGGLARGAHGPFFRRRRLGAHHADRQGLFFPSSSTSCPTTRRMSPGKSHPP